MGNLVTGERNIPDGRPAMTFGALGHDPRHPGGEHLLDWHHSPWTDPRAGRPPATFRRPAAGQPRRPGPRRFSRSCWASRRLLIADFRTHLAITSPRAARQPS